MVDAGVGQRLVECGHRVGWDRLVRAPEQAEDRASHVGHAIDRCRDVASSGTHRQAVEADRAGEVEAERRREEAGPPAVAEADAEHGPRRSGLGGAEECGTRANVGRDAGPRRPSDVIHVLEVVAALDRARGPAEVVDRDGVDTVLREPERELLVEGVQAADVGQDHRARAGRLRRACPECAEARAVVRVEGDPGRVEGAPGDRRDRRPGIGVEAHRVILRGTSPLLGGRDRSRFGARRGAGSAGSIVHRASRSCGRVPDETRSCPYGVRRRDAIEGLPGSRTGRARIRRMPALVVQKFGGSSVADADRIRRVARRIARERAAGNQLVVVVSAMGDATDELLALAAAITDEPDPRELDMLLATGEHQSATLVSMALHALDVPAISLTGPQAGITTDGRYGRALIANVEPERVRRELVAGRVVIVAGFQGRSARIDDGAPAPAAHDTEITTLGRGGSDTTAVALAATLRADRCQVFTDVRGIYTADPRIEPAARQLPVIGYEEMLELAGQGAQVMQTRAVELGWVNGVVIEVLSSFEDAPGTQITEDPEVEQRNKVRGLAHDRNVAKVTLVEVPDKPGVAAEVFAPLAEAGINVDMIVQNVGHRGATDLSFTIPEVELAKAKRILEPVVRQLGFRELTTDAAVAKVSIVGAGIQNAPGYAARMFSSLAAAGINIEMISTSEIRITCMIAEDRVEDAVRALHATFELERPETARVDSPAAAAG